MAPVASRPGKAPAIDSSKASKLMTEGDELLKNGEHERAIKKFQRAHRLEEGGSFDALMRIAHTYRFMGDTSRAVRIAQEAIEIAATPVEKAAAEALIGWSFYQAVTFSIRGATPGSTDSDWEQIHRWRELARTFLLQAVEDSPATTAEAHYLLAQVIENDQPALRSQHLSDYLRLEPEGRYAGEARSILDHLACAAQLADAPIAIPSPPGDEMDLPSKVYAPQPQYTEIARQARIQGLVVVHFIIEKTGSVVCTGVSKGLPMGLEEAAVAAVKEWKFEPATLNGEPISVYYHLGVNYRLRVGTATRTITIPRN